MKKLYIENEAQIATLRDEISNLKTQNQAAVKVPQIIAEESKTQISQE